jgi:dihydroorotase
VKRHDLLIAGGTVIDPASRLHARHDMAIADGRIVAVEPHLSASSAADLLDATDLLVPTPSRASGARWPR